MSPKEDILASYRTLQNYAEPRRSGGRSQSLLPALDSKQMQRSRVHKETLLNQQTPPTDIGENPEVLWLVCFFDEEGTMGLDFASQGA